MENQSFIVWKEQYSVGNGILDRQHQFIVGLINRLYETKLAENAEDQLDALVDSLYRYTKTHFATEERLLEAAAFPEIEPHRALHLQMEQKTRDLKKRCLADKSQLTEDLFDFLKSWWLGHILQEDFTYRPYLAGRA